MANIYKGTIELIGNTPLVEAVNLEQAHDLQATLLIKLEYLNPAGSVKDRIAKSMLEDAEQSGKLHTGSVIIEPTSGNTGIGLAAIAAAKGYRVILTVPPKEIPIFNLPFEKSALFSLMPVHSVWASKVQLQPESYRRSRYA